MLILCERDMSVICSESEVKIPMKTTWRILLKPDVL